MIYSLAKKFKKILFLHKPIVLLKKLYFNNFYYFSHKKLNFNDFHFAIKIIIPRKKIYLPFYESRPYMHLFNTYKQKSSLFNNIYLFIYNLLKCYGKFFFIRSKMKFSKKKIS
jgi:hypothetical protein